MPFFGLVQLGLQGKDRPKKHTDSRRWEGWMNEPVPADRKESVWLSPTSAWRRVKSSLFPRRSVGVLGRSDPTSVRTWRFGSSRGASRSVNWPAATRSAARFCIATPAGLPTRWRPVSTRRRTRRTFGLTYPSPRRGGVSSSWRWCWRGTPRSGASRRFSKTSWTTRA